MKNDLEDLARQVLEDEDADLLATQLAEAVLSYLENEYWNAVEESGF